MPWSPTFESVDPDPRLDPHRGRAAQLSQAGTPVGYLLVETDYLQVRTGGFAWWRQWAPPQEFAIVSVLIDEEIAEGRTYALDELTAVISDWASGTHTSGATYDVTWLDPQESDRIHQEIFGHHH